MSLQDNTTQLQSILDAVNSLPEVSGINYRVLSQTDYDLSGGILAIFYPDSVDMQDFGRRLMFTIFTASSMILVLDNLHGKAEHINSSGTQYVSNTIVDFLTDRYEWVVDPAATNSFPDRSVVEVYYE